jgi:RNA polymerase sigma factor (sigma-70 family)
MLPTASLPPLRRSLLLVWALPTGESTGHSGEGAEAAIDPDDLSRLVTDYGEAIYRVALSVVRDRATAEDVAQETLVKAWVALPTFRGDASLKSWVLRIAHNTAISFVRARRAVVMDPFTMPDATLPQERSVERRVENTAAMGDFVNALGELDELSRSVVVLREVEGLHYDEISQILDVPLSTVKTRLMRARRRLGSALEEWAP